MREPKAGYCQSARFGFRVGKVRRGVQPERPDVRARERFTARNALRVSGREGTHAANECGGELLTARRYKERETLKKG